MPVTMERSRRRKRRKRTSAKGAIICLIVLALMIAGIWYAFFFPKQIEKTVYPLEYLDVIRKYSSEFNLDPARVAAVIYCESSFRPSAVSSAGAVGLMQIMPSTGQWIAKKLDMDGYSDEDLVNPEDNIKMGCWYLDYLDKRFDYDLKKSTAAYHAGGGSVDKWLDDKENSSDGVTLDSIPSKVTGEYVARVASAYEQYKEIID